MSVLSLGAARAGVITIAAASALALLALPSAAHAAEVVTCTPEVTAESAPWLTFSQSENFYVPFSAAFGTFLTTSTDLTLDFPESFTESDLTAYEQEIIAAEETFSTALAAIADADGSVELETQLAAADPDNTTGWKENLANLEAGFAKIIDSSGYEPALESFGAALTTFSDEADALVTADVPAGGPFERPEIPASFVTDRDTAVGALQTIARDYQTSVLNESARFVVYEDVCVTTTVPDAAVAAAPAAPAKTLAATGTSDGLVLGSASGMLLLAGAATLILVRRRSA
jgi:hypothetical protein